MSTSKTGKHGHAKCNFTALDIFTNKKLEDMCPSTHNVEVRPALALHAPFLPCHLPAPTLALRAQIPNVARFDFSLADVTEDGFVALMADNGDMREDLQLPTQTEDDQKLAETIRNDFEEGKELVISVLKAMGEEKIIASKVANN